MLVNMSGRSSIQHVGIVVLKTLVKYVIQLVGNLFVSYSSRHRILVYFTGVKMMHSTTNFGGHRLLICSQVGMHIRVMESSSWNSEQIVAAIGWRRGMQTCTFWQGVYMQQNPCINAVLRIKLRVCSQDNSINICTMFTGMLIYSYYAYRHAYLFITYKIQVLNISMRGTDICIVPGEGTLRCQMGLQPSSTTP